MRFFNFKELDSTNEFMKKNINSFHEYDIVTAETQTKGKARRGNIWFSNKGMALFTFKINEKEALKSNEYLKLPLIVGLSVIKGLKKIENLDYMFKWTNDVYLNGKKLSGILVEKVDTYFIIGIGINVNNDVLTEIKNIATSLKEATNKNYNISNIITSIVKEFSILYEDFEKGNWKEILKEINNINYLKNSTISLKVGNMSITGIAKNINLNGEIEILYNKKIQSFSMGEILKERIIVGINENYNSHLAILKFQKLGYDVIGVYLCPLKKNKIEYSYEKEIENFAKNSKIKFEKIQIENDINDILLFENLYYIAKKYNTSYISTGHKITISSSIMTFISKNNLTFISPF